MTLVQFFKLSNDLGTMYQDTEKQWMVYNNSTFLSHLEIIKDVTKEILRRNLIKTRLWGVVGCNIILF